MCDETRSYVVTAKKKILYINKYVLIVNYRFTSREYVNMLVNMFVYIVYIIVSIKFVNKRV